HVIVEEAPGLQTQTDIPQPYQLLVFSAHNRTSLRGNIQRLLQHLQLQPDRLEDVAYTLQVARKAFPLRSAFVCRDTADALQQLEQASKGDVQVEQAKEATSVVFLFPGQGAQYVNMAHMLYTTQPVFRMHIEHCAQLLAAELGLDLRQVLFPAD